MRRTNDVAPGMARVRANLRTCCALVPTWIGVGIYVIPVRDLPGASAAYFTYYHGMDAGQALEIVTPGGGHPPPGLRLVIRRLF